jgi:hypothetical protein
VKHSLRLLVYDATWVGRQPVQAGLTSSWIAGSALYRALDRVDAVYGARSWEDALAWLCSVEPTQPVGEIQYWGHGRFGRIYVAKEFLDKDAVDDETHSRHQDLVALRARMTPQSLWWFRTCETFGRADGHAFATSWTRFFQCRAAGHTYVIGPLQSGLHSLAPGETPTWSLDEGTRPGREVAETSALGAPNTITCLHGSIPQGW